MAIQASEYQVFKIYDKNYKRSIDITATGFSVTNFYYYENILSPYITGVAVIVSTGDVMVSKDDVQQRVGSLYSSLPLEAGCALLVRVKTKLGPGIDFDQEPEQNNGYNCFYIDEVQVLERDSSKEVIQIRFNSKFKIANATSTVKGAFKGTISESVKAILTQSGKRGMNVPESIIQIDETDEPYSFNGMQEKPFIVIGMLARQSVSSTKTGQANPGYFFYESQSGFKYKAISSLVVTRPIANYHYDGMAASSYEEGGDINDYKIAYFSVLKDQQLVKQIESGVYASKNIFFNPKGYNFTEIDISVDTGDLIEAENYTPLGKKGDSTPEVVMRGLKDGKEYHRIQSTVLAIEPLEDGSLPDVNNSPEMYYAAASTRYNILFSQSYSVTVPCNTALEVGNTVKLFIDNVSYCTKVEGGDARLDGTYIIKSLCHYFDGEHSVTSMEVIRDSYGLVFNTEDADPADALLSNWMERDFSGGTNQKNQETIRNTSTDRYRIDPGSI